jgi:hypothetical protein
VERIKQEILIAEPGSFRAGRIQNDFGPRDPPEKQSEKKAAGLDTGLLGRERSSQIGEKGVGREEMVEITRSVIWKGDRGDGSAEGEVGSSGWINSTLNRF